MDVLAGYKTYMIVVLLLLVGVCRSQGWIDERTAESVFAILVGGAFATQRLATAKVEARAALLPAMQAQAQRTAERVVDISHAVKS